MNFTNTDCVKNCIWYQMDDQVYNQVHDQVNIKVYYQLDDQVWDQISPIKYKIEQEINK